MLSHRPIQLPDPDLTAYGSGVHKRSGWDTAQVSGWEWLRAGVSTQADCAIVTLSGELDIASTGALGRRLSALVRQGFTRIVIDLADLVFCDASGLGLLVRARGETIRHGGWLRIADAGPTVERIIGITGLRRVLPVYATVEEALAGHVITLTT